VTRTCVIAMAALAVLLAACSDDSGTNAPGTLPRVSNLAVTSNSNNVLSAILTLEPTNVDSARVVYWTGSDAKQYTPFVGDTGTSRMVVLGLRPGTQYNLAVEAKNSHAQHTSDTVTFTTDTLPTFLASSSFAGASPSSGGYILTSIFDGTSAHIVAGESLQAGLERRRAGRAAGQSVAIFPDVGGRIDPPPRAVHRALHGDRRVAAAERRHRLGEAHGEAGDGIAVGAGDGLEDGRGRVARRRHRRERQKDHRDSCSQAPHTHLPVAPDHARTASVRPAMKRAILSMK